VAAFAEQLITPPLQTVWCLDSPCKRRITTNNMQRTQSRELGERTDSLPEFIVSNRAKTYVTVTGVLIVVNH
jgi:hypothetical protein